MIEGLKPYPVCRQSGVSWLGRIPDHWKISRSKRLFPERKDLALPGDVQLSATQAYGVIPQSEYEERVGRRVVRISMHLEKRRHVERDDFVISMRSFQGGLERAWASGAIRSSYVVLKAEAGADVGYFAHMFKSQGYIRALQATADFIRDGQDLNFGHFTRVDLPLPPLVEQAAIGRFLNHATRRIDRFIRAKRKLIALLNEQKQAIVQCAVTQGIDPNVRHVDSGVEWLGRVPAHWVVRRIKYLLREVDVRSATGDEMLLSMRMHHGIVPFAEHFARPPQAASLAGFKIVRPGQLVINRMQAGNGVIFPSNLHGLVSPDYAVFDPICDLDVAFLGELFRCRKVRGKFRAESKGLGTGTSGFLRLYNDRLGAIPIALPPRVEQNAILHGLAGRLEGLNAALDRTEREIALIREYRARLIADVVTGQLDVRAAAASLPPDEPTPSDSPDPDSDSPDLAEDDLPPEDDPA